MQPPSLSSGLTEAVAVEAERVTEELRVDVVPGLSAAVLRAGSLVGRLDAVPAEAGSEFYGRVADAVDAMAADGIVTVMPMGDEDSDRAMVVVWAEESSGSFVAIVQPYRQTADGIALYPPSAAGPGRAGNAFLEPVREVWRRSV